MSCVPTLQGIRIIAIDRPGYGHSTYKHDLTFESLAEDVECLLDQLGLHSVTIMASSGGLPACLPVCDSRAGPTAALRARLVFRAVLQLPGAVFAAPWPPNFAPAPEGPLYRFLTPALAALAPPDPRRRLSLRQRLRHGTARPHRGAAAGLPAGADAGPGGGAAKRAVPARQAHLQDLQRRALGGAAAAGSDAAGGRVRLRVGFWVGAGRLPQHGGEEGLLNGWALCSITK